MQISAESPAYGRVAMPFRRRTREKVSVLRLLYSDHFVARSLLKSARDKVRIPAGLFYGASYFHSKTRASAGQGMKKMPRVFALMVVVLVIVCTRSQGCGQP